MMQMARKAPFHSILAIWDTYLVWAGEAEEVGVGAYAVNLRQQAVPRLGSEV